jgi:hypothetical protein
MLVGLVALHGVVRASRQEDELLTWPIWRIANFAWLEPGVDERCKHLAATAVPERRTRRN